MFCSFEIDDTSQNESSAATSNVCIAILEKASIEVKVFGNEVTLTKGTFRNIIRNAQLSTDGCLPILAMNGKRVRSFSPGKLPRGDQSQDKAHNGMTNLSA